MADIDTFDSITLEPRLQFFPVAWFSTVMGLGGLTIAWLRAEQVFGLSFTVWPVLLALTAFVFFTLALLYTAKYLIYPRAVAAELQHPVKLAFAPTFSIGMLLLSIACLHPLPTVSFWLWSIGTVLHLLVTLHVVSSWMHHKRYEIKHLNPAWFIPAVGNILVPIAGMQHAPADISWLFFSIGMFFWPVLSAIILQRLIFNPVLPERLMPTLFILIAPPAVGFLAWFNLTGNVDSVGRMLYFIALFFALLLASQLRYFVRLKFFLSWWAYSFPLAAITIATMVMLKATGTPAYAWLAGSLLVVLTLVVLGLVVRTALAVWRREICIEGD